MVTLMVIFLFRFSIQDSANMLVSRHSMHMVMCMFVSL